MHLAIYITAALAAIFNLSVELRRCLMMFQQNSYRPERYQSWLKTSGDSTTPKRLIGIFVFFLALASFATGPASALFIGIFSLCSGISLAKKKYKKPLVMTMRASRIFYTALVITAIIAAIAIVFFGKRELNASLLTLCDTLLGGYCISHILILAANYVLSPVEKHITKRYYDDAARILAAMPDLKIIGVTGSYGKTTTKHYLHAILSEHFETLMTPGSYNTTLGVVRTVREMLKPYHEVFIVEMGAKNIGDIREICDLVHPQGGIVTAVGPQHLESFKTIENVQATKFELVDAIPTSGFAVINNDFEKIADRPVSNTSCIRYAIKNTDGADYIARNIEYSASGTRFIVERVADHHTIELSTRLIGECNISNILAAVAVAHRLGVPDQRIAFAVEKIEQVEHRLSIKRIPGGLTIIDDAFNSNPVGSAMALDVLATMTGGKRYLITPGMIELGAEQYELNHKFGIRAATSCDIAIVVGQYNRDAIVAGLTEGGMAPENIKTVDSFTEAQQLLTSTAKVGDTVLYENDLPDTFK